MIHFTQQRYARNTTRRPWNNMLVLAVLLFVAGVIEHI